MTQVQNSMIDRLEEVLISIFLGVATLIVFFQVVARYVFNSGISWAPELVEHMFLWTVMIGASYGFKHGVHLGVDVLVKKLPPKAQRLATLLAVFISVFFASTMCYLSIFYVHDSYVMELVTVDLEIPRWIPHLALPFGFGLITIRLLQAGWLVYVGRRATVIRSGEPPAAQPGEQG